MRDTIEARKIWQRLAGAVAVGLFGLVGLPIVFGGLPDPTRALVWLGLAITDSACLIPATMLLASPLASLLLRLPVHALQVPTLGRATVDVARLMVAALALVLVQAILRHPLVAVFGANAEPFVIEAVLASAVMLALGVLFVWLHREAGPLIESAAQAALDAALATSSSRKVPQRATTSAPVPMPAGPAPETVPSATVLSRQTTRKGEGTTGAEHPHARSGLK